MENVSSRNGRILIAILAVSLAARLLFGAFAVGMDAPPEGDAVTYDQIGMNLVTQRAYVQYHDTGVWYSVRTPFLPFLLAGVYSLTGHSFVASRLLMIAIGSAIPLAVFALGRLVYGRRVAVVAGLISACYPFFLLFSNVLLSEAPFTLLVCLSLVFLVRFLHSRRAVDLCLAGVMVGLGCLCRATLLTFIPVCFVWLLAVARPGWGGAVKAGLLFTIFALAVIAPWTYRNYLVHGTLIPVSSRGGVVLWYGNNQWATGDIARDYHGLLAHLPDARTTSEAEIHRISQQRALEFIRAHPGRFVSLGLKKMFHFWRPTALRSPGALDAYSSTVTRVIGPASYLPVFTLFLLGWLMSLRKMSLLRDPRLQLLILLIATYTLIHVLFPPVPRYRQPIEPAMILIGSWAILEIGARLHKPGRAAGGQPG